MVRYTAVSSAKNLVSDLTCSCRSLIYGSETGVLWDRAPGETRILSEAMSFITTN